MNKELKIAIMEKVEDILDNMGCVQSMSLDIYLTQEEAPSVTYRVKELICNMNREE